MMLGMGATFVLSMSGLLSSVSVANLLAAQRRGG